MRALLLLAPLALAACSTETPLDNGAATGCVPGTPEQEASALCNETTLPDGNVVVAPENSSADEPARPTI